MTVDPAELWDSPLGVAPATSGAFWRGLSEADSRVAELESLRAENYHKGLLLEQLRRERSELHRQRDEWRRRAVRAESLNRNRGLGADE